jgi:hypothetical protein
LFSRPVDFERISPDEFVIAEQNVMMLERKTFRSFSISVRIALDQSGQCIFVKQRFRWEAGRGAGAPPYGAKTVVL